MHNNTDRKIKKLMLISCGIFLLNIIIIFSTFYFMGINGHEGSNMSDSQMVIWMKYTFLPVIILRCLFASVVFMCNIFIFVNVLPIFNEVTNFKSPINRKRALFGIGFLLILPLSFVNIIYILILRFKYKKTHQYNNLNSDVITN